MNFSFDHTDWQSTVAKNEKIQAKMGQNLKNLHIKELYTVEATSVWTKDSVCSKSILFKMV